MIKVQFIGGPKDGQTIDVVSPAQKYPIIVPAENQSDNKVVNYVLDRSRKFYIWETIKKWPI